jgi:hypothetical protein
MTSRLPLAVVCLVCLLSALATIGCEEQDPSTTTHPDGETYTGPIAVASPSKLREQLNTPALAPEDNNQTHAHAAPHGGTLVELGSHVAQVELLLDSATGQITLFLFDGHAQHPLRIAAPRIEITVAPTDPQGPPVIFDLLPVANPLTGETTDDTSQFQARHDELRNVQRATVLIRAIPLPSRTFTEIAARISATPR